MTSDEDRPPPLWPFLLLCAAVAGWIVFGTLHRLQHSDALINILSSLYAWQPFFWDQDRYGSLVPLLAIPVRHPLANLLVQEWITTFAALAARFLLARWLFRSAAYPLAAAVSLVAFLALADATYRFEHLVDTGYGVPFSLAFTSLILIEPSADGRVPRRRLLLAGTLMVLAHWVFLAVFLTVAPMAMGRCLLHPGGPPRDGWLARRLASRQLWRTAALLGVGLASGMLLRKFAAAHGILRTTLAGLPVAEWPSGWWTLLLNCWNRHEPAHAWPIFWLSLAAFVPIVFMVSRRSRAALVPAIAAAIGAAAAFLFIATRFWTQDNAFDYRYGMPSQLLLEAALAGPLVCAWRPRWNGWPGRLLGLALASGLLAAAWTAYGLPSLAGVRADLRSRLGEHAEAVNEARCTHVAGDYWFVWRTVYYANLLRHEQGNPEPVWGIAMRGRPAWKHWRAMPPARIRIACLPGGLPDAEPWLEQLKVPPLRLVEQRGTIWVYEIDDSAVE